jgi:hypothetical protein
MTVVYPFHATMHKPCNTANILTLHQISQFDMGRSAKLNLMSQVLLRENSKTCVHTHFASSGVMNITTYIAWYLLAFHMHHLSSHMILVGHWRSASAMFCSVNDRCDIDPPSYFPAVFTLISNALILSAY